MKENSVIIFNNGLFGEVRFVDVEGKPYAIATDVAKALGYRNTRDAIQKHCKGVAKHDTLTSGGIQELNIIPEGDIYRLIIKSKLKKAQQFEEWVMNEVLPQIRTTGGYIPIKEEESELEILSKAFVIAQKTIGDKDDIIRLKNDMIKQQGEIIKEQGVIVDYYEKVIDPPKLISSTDIAKDLGMTARKLHKILHMKNIIYKRDHDKCWKFYQKYENMIPTHADYSINEYAQTLKWTELGRRFIIGLIENDPETQIIIADIDEQRKESRKAKSRRKKKEEVLICQEDICTT